MLIKVDDVNIWEQHNSRIIDKREVHMLQSGQTGAKLKPKWQMMPWAAKDIIYYRYCEISTEIQTEQDVI